MINIGINDLSKPSNSIDFDLIKAIVNRVIKTSIADTVRAINFDVSELLWYPTWKWDRKNKKKKLRDIYVRLSHQPTYKKISISLLSLTGLHLYEFFEYLERSDAQRTKYSR